MALLASHVITKARFKVSDTGGTRFSDQLLIDFLNNGIADIARSTRLYNETSYVPIEIRTSFFDLSKFAISIERVEHEGVVLKPLTFEEMDKRYGNEWQLEEDPLPTHIVYDLLQPANFRIYPIPSVGNTTLHQSNSLYGGITAIYYQNVDLAITGAYGDINPDTTKQLLVYYIKQPKQIVEITDELDDVIDIGHVSVLAHYVAGQALRVNQDTLSRKVGNEELAMYQASKKDLENTKNVNNTRRLRNTGYNPRN